MAKLTPIKRREDLEYLHDRMYRSGQTQLYMVYGRYSDAKESAFDYCKELQYALNGFQGAIITHNSFIFTFGFYYNTVDEETGELHENFCYITPSYNYTWQVD